MDIWAIVFLVIGGIIVVLSFVIPARNEEKLDATEAIAKRELQEMIAMEMENIRGHVDDVVEEAVGYAMEKTERSLERLSNEKIMAVNEYSDTVLQEIHRNHEEVMFLYDMLNDKHQSLKNTVTEVNKTVKEVAEKKKETEIVVDSFQTLIPENIIVETEIQKEETIPTVEMTVEESDPDGSKRNEKILALYQLGKSKVEIAKELGMGVGEVKLIIDLYQNA